MKTLNQLLIEKKIASEKYSNAIRTMDWMGEDKDFVESYRIACINKDAEVAQKRQENRDCDKYLEEERKHQTTFKNLPEEFKNIVPKIMEMAETENRFWGECYAISFYNKVAKYTKGNEEIKRFYFTGVEVLGLVIGNGGAFEVRTIFAGGWNVQRFHYRVIVTPV
jgi:hypothetical protein